MNKSKKIENTTGDLYHSCWLEFTQDQWTSQGDLLAEQLGLNQENVSGKTVLDGGCGHGALCYKLSTLNAEKVVGVDLKPTPKEEKFTDKNVEFIAGSLMELPFESNTFDLVVSSGVLHHTTNPEKGASELYRVLKNNGELIIGVYGKYGLFPWCLWLMRIFTIKIPLVPIKLVDKIIKKLGLNPIWRYQVLDYLYVPILKRYTPKQVKEKFFKANGIKETSRVSNITKEKGKDFTSRHTSYSYDYRSLKSRILFGHGFIVIKGIKNETR